MSNQLGTKNLQPSLLIEALTAITGVAYTPEEQAAIQDAGRWARIAPYKARQWVDHCGRLADLLAGRRAVISDVAWFWITLYGLLNELGPYFKKHADLFGEEAVPVADQIARIRSLLSADEV